MVQESNLFLLIFVFMIIIVVPMVWIFLENILNNLYLMIMSSSQRIPNCRDDIGWGYRNILSFPFENIIYKYYGYPNQNPCLTGNQIINLGMEQIYDFYNQMGDK